MREYHLLPPGLRPPTRHDCDGNCLKEDDCKELFGGKCADMVGDKSVSVLGGRECRLGWPVYDVILTAHWRDWQLPMALASATETRGLLGLGHFSWAKREVAEPTVSSRECRRAPGGERLCKCQYARRHCGWAAPIGAATGTTRPSRQLVMNHD